MRLRHVKNKKEKRKKKKKGSTLVFLFFLVKQTGLVMGKLNYLQELRLFSWPFAWLCHRASPISTQLSVIETIRTVSKHSNKL